MHVSMSVVDVCSRDGLNIHCLLVMTEVVIVKTSGFAGRKISRREDL